MYRVYEPTARREAFPLARPRGDGGAYGNGGSRSTAGEHALAKALGWFSIGLGLTEMTVPRGLTRMLGVGDHDALVRALGVREVASGLGILSQPRRAGWLWSRVGGDVMDLAHLAAALGTTRKRASVLASLAAVGGVTMLDVVAGDRLSRRSRGTPGVAAEGGAVEVVETVAIMATAEECYRFWRELENLPRFMKHLESVTEGDERRSHWVARAPGGRVEWDAEITEDVPGERISWRSLEGSDVASSGTVHFLPEPAGRGTIIEVTFAYEPPLGGAGVTLAMLVGEEPEQQVREDLRRLKQIMETGEVATTVGQSSGRARGPAGRRSR